MVLLYTEKNILFQGSRGVLHFPGGGGSNFFQGGGGGGGGVQMLISIETHITCDFPGGRGALDPLSPLWICTCYEPPFHIHVRLKQVCSAIETYAIESILTIKAANV